MWVGGEGVDSGHCMSGRRCTHTHSHTHAHTHTQVCGEGGGATADGSSE